jgi:hypothetical protein
MTPFTVYQVAPDLGWGTGGQFVPLTQLAATPGFSRILSGGPSTWPEALASFFALMGATRGGIQVYANTPDGTALNIRVAQAIAPQVGIYSGLRPPTLNNLATGAAPSAQMQKGWQYQNALNAMPAASTSPKGVFWIVAGVLVAIGAAVALRGNA